MSTQLSMSVLERLAFIRYMYTQGVEQAARPEPYSASSVLLFHDSVELFLRLATEQPGVTFNKKATFMEYWEMVLPNSAQLTQKTGMNKLNEVRNGLKHHGLRPRKENIDDLQTLTTAFFEENTPVVFGLDFNSISMLDLIQHEKARENLQEAMAFIESQQYKEALEKIAIAFTRLSKELEGRWVEEIHGTKIRSTSKYRVRSAGLSAGRDVHLNAVGRLASDMGGSLNELQGALNQIEFVLQIVVLQVPFWRYLRFRKLTPHCWASFGTDEGRAYHVAWHVASTYQPTLTDCRFCFDFVLECAVRIQELVVAIDQP